MPTPILAVVKLAKKSGIPADAPQMSFAFSVGDLLLATLTGVASSVEAFYKSVPTGSAFALQVILSQSLSVVGNLSSVTMYDLTGHLDGTPHGAPVASFLFGLTAVGTATVLPDQVAAVLSMHSAFGSDVEFAPHARPRAKDRGRVYIGPLDSSVIVQDAVTKEPRIDTPVTAVIANAAKALLAAQPGWSVWSRKDAALKPITGGWVDNRPDIQRRRAAAASTRLTWP